MWAAWSVGHDPNCIGFLWKKPPMEAYRFEKECGASFHSFLINNQVMLHNTHLYWVAWWGLAARLWLSSLARPHGGSSKIQEKRIGSIGSRPQDFRQLECSIILSAFSWWSLTCLNSVAQCRLEQRLVSPSPPILRASAAPCKSQARTHASMRLLKTTTLHLSTNYKGISPAREQLRQSYITHHSKKNISKSIQTRCSDPGSFTNKSPSAPPEATCARSLLNHLETNHYTHLQINAQKQDEILHSVLHSANSEKPKYYQSIRPPKTRTSKPLIFSFPTTF